ncbi:MAG: Fe-S cluster assembly protein SufD [Nitrospina sp.]|nr:Fe-S cluster assembly protein SufD [Nitrospina sp.]
MSDVIEALSREAEVAEFHRKFVKDGSVPAFQSINAAGIARFEELGFPHAKHEMYTFVNTHELANTRFQLTQGQADAAFVDANTYPACQKARLVFVDGQYDPALSETSGLPQGVSLVALPEALEKEPGLKSCIEKGIAEENDVFASLNAAFVNAGLLIDFAENTVLETPLLILHIGTASKEPVVHHPRLLLRLGRTAEAKVIHKYVGEGGGYCVNAVQDVLLEDGAGLTLARVQADPADAWHLEKLRVFQKRDSRFTALCGSGGCRMARVHYEIHLQGEGAETNLSNASVLTENDQSHHFVRIHHEVPHTTSHQLFKNVIGGKGRSSVDGTVIVNEGAQLTSSEQLINNLMLSDTAHADNKPNLMIFADDVKCTHGATVGQIDKDQLFYLKTRGLEESLATELLTTSFVESLIREIPFPEVVEDLENLLLGKLEVKRD